MKFRILFALLCCLGYSISAGAAAPVDCWPNPTRLPKWGDVPPTAGIPETKWAGWECPNGFRVVVFTLDEMTPWLRQYMDGRLTEAQAEASFQAQKRNDPKVAAFARTVFVDHFGSQPLALTNVCYSQRVTVNAAPTYRAVCKIPVGTECIRTGPAGSYMPIDRNKAVMDSSIAVKPPVLYALCG